MWSRKSEKIVIILVEKHVLLQSFNLLHFFNKNCINIAFSKKILIFVSQNNFKKIRHVQKKVVVLFFSLVIKIWLDNTQTGRKKSEITKEEWDALDCCSEMDWAACRVLGLLSYLLSSLSRTGRPRGCSGIGA